VLHRECEWRRGNHRFIDTPPRHSCTAIPPVMAADPSGSDGYRELVDYSPFYHSCWLITAEQASWHSCMWHSTKLHRAGSTGHPLRAKASMALNYIFADNRLFH
jgi:hypothetical protein